MELPTYVDTKLFATNLKNYLKSYKALNSLMFYYIKVEREDVMGK